VATPAEVFAEPEAEPVPASVPVIPTQSKRRARKTLAPPRS
jgi:hypothetical protein